MERLICKRVLCQEMRVIINNDVIKNRIGRIRRPPSYLKDYHVFSG